MKKYGFLIAFSIGLICTGLGLATSAKKAVAVHADNILSLTFDKDDVCTFGSYPQTIDPGINASDIVDGIFDPQKDCITIKGNVYRPMTAVVDLEKTGKLSNGTSTTDIKGVDSFFKFEPLKWKLLSYDEKNKICTIVTNNVIDREIFDDGNQTNYNNAPLLERFLNTDANGFYEVAFNDNEKASILDSSFNNVKHKVLIPSKNDFDILLKDIDFKPTDYAICSELSSHLTYDNAPMWTTDNLSGRVTVKWNKDTTTNCLVTDPKIGVIAMINVQAEIAKKSSSGGGGSSSTSKASINFNGNVPMMVIGLVLLGGGLVVLVILLNKWHKNIKANPGFKCKWHCFLIIGLVLVTSIVGLYLYAYATTLKMSFAGIGGSKYHIYGLYVSCTYLDDDDGSEDWDWADITHGVYALSKDGKIYHYIGNWPVGKEIIREPGEGSYVVKGNEITLTFPDTWRTFSFEHSPMTYKLSYSNGWEVKFTLDEGVQFQEQVPPPVSGSGIYYLNYNSFASNHDPDGRPYYTKGELGF